MKSTVENLNPTKVKLAVEVPYEEFKSQMDHVFRDYARQINVPGFRPGKAPARVVESYIGRQAVIEEAVNHGLPEYYGQAIEDNKLSPLGQPEVEVTDTPNVEGTPGGELKFTVEVEIRPEVELPDFSQLELVVEAVEISESDTAEELDNLRRRFASLKTVERRVQDGDFVTLDLITSIDGEEIDNLAQASYQVGQGGLVPGLDEALDAMEADSDKEFTTQLQSGPHGGREATVKVHVDSVKEQVLPEADDEFAQMVSEHDTIQDLRQELADSVSHQKRARQALEARDALVEKLRDELEFPLPEGVIESRVSEQTDDSSSEEDKQRIREMVTSDLKTQIILDTLAEQRQVSVSQQELLEFVLQTAQTYGMNPSTLLQSAEQNNRLPAFIQEIARNKSVAAALGEVQVQDKQGNAVDLSEFVGDDDEEDDSEQESSADDED